MYNWALQGFEEALGPKHTSTLGTVHNLGFFNETGVLDPIFSSRLGLDQWIDQSVHNLVSQLISTIRSPKSQARLADQLNIGPKVQSEDGTMERKVSAESPSSLFRQLALWLDGDMVDLLFDGLGFHSICGEIWDRIAEQMLQLNRKGADRHGQWAISTMAKDILTDAAKDEGKAGCIEFDNEDFALPLRIAWKEIQAYIQEPVSQPPDLRGKVVL
ncbi:hypothetical protein BS50DRAFT_637439 [Corynespora cassiicola Philippines]|uniref:Uncharacterized protein n=1 Tax=Corynespora cassiicola Philippines TaxID=1448308 RepID=A0A2T2NFE6_CORCC|nr:hypothetical protein BS50DRAFT_637439 [Corynespora cassiicola Philippines]